MAQCLTERRGTRTLAQFYEQTDVFRDEILRAAPSIGTLRCGFGHWAVDVTSYG